jgi:[acyl-carrier-protein] S-malonyltransferase
MKTAFLFPGQGAQKAGMGEDICQSYNCADDIFNKASQIAGYDLKKLCFEDPEEKLNSTVYSQPAIFVTSAAILEVLRSEENLKKIKPEVTAGLSMGEYSALYAAGLISFEQGLKLVQKRGQEMQKAADATEGAMVSILGLDQENVEKLCQKAREKDEILVPVNFNCPGQIVISGTKTACRRAAELAEEFGAIKAVPLAVAGGFHTDLMAPAAVELKKALENANISDPKSLKPIANINAEYYNTAEQICDGLTKQLVMPLLWQKCMEKLLEDGFDKFYEIGPSRVLTGLMKRINRKIKVVNLSTAKAIKDLQLQL